MSVRAKDIAKQLGISEATMSLVVNGKPGISKKTRARVIQQLNELGYGYFIQNQNTDPASVPGGSVPDKKKTIGFVLYKSNGALLGMNSFFPLILDGLENTAREHGYSLVVINMEKNSISEQIRYIKDANCTGYVIFATEMQETDIEYFEALGLPYVILDNYFVGRDINSVKVNNQQGTYRLVQYLYEMGHRKIGYLGSGLSINSFEERRLYAFQAMEFFGIKNPQQYYYIIGYPHEKATEGMQQILNRIPKKDLPTAFLADNDLVAIGGMLAARRFGYQIPEDFSFVGYDDRPICTLSDPQLTTLQLPRGRFGSEAVYQLIHMIQNHSSTVKVEINGKLIERASVAKQT